MTVAFTESERLLARVGGLKPDLAIGKDGLRRAPPRLATPASVAGLLVTDVPLQTLPTARRNTKVDFDIGTRRFDGRRTTCLPSAVALTGAFTRLAMAFPAFVPMHQYSHGIWSGWRHIRMLPPGAEKMRGRHLVAALPHPNT